MTKCRGCGQDIVFMAHPKTGKPHPFELDRQTSHFIGCPARQTFAPPQPGRRSAPQPAEQGTLFGDINPIPD